MATTPHTQQLLISIAKNNEKAAFATFYNYYHARLIRFALLFLKSYQDAEDVVSEVMIKLLKQKDRLPEIKNFEGYLYLAIKNQALNLLKKHQIKTGISVDIGEDHLTHQYVQPYDSILAEELRNLIFATVEKLPPKRRMVYKMVKDDGLKIKEVAELLEIAEKTVKKHLELAIRSLKEVVELYNSEKKSSTPVISIKSKAGLILLLISLSFLI
ncbi:MAG: RNA polymerase sigma factor [Cyclobacteriaceae bacterium]